ncbi:MAG: hypothetical protein ACREM8_07335, partial [Vulcanimicrobiaceae bacterium]
MLAEQLDLTTEAATREFREALARAIKPGGNSQLAEFAPYIDQPLNDIREAFRAEWGYDPETVWSQSKAYGFSLNAVRESIAKHTMREAVTQAQFYALTRYGVNRQIVDGYKLVPTVYKDVSYVINSTASEELYFPLYGTDVPDAVEDGEQAGESRMAGFSVRILNQRFAKILNISKTLFRNDQTGQIKMQTSE